VFAQVVGVVECAGVSDRRGRAEELPLAYLTLAAVVALAASGVWLQALIFRSAFPPIGIIITVARWPSRA
jgi:hypothetical protein